MAQIMTDLGKFFYTIVLQDLFVLALSKFFISVTRTTSTPSLQVIFAISNQHIIVVVI